MITYKVVNEYSVEDLADKVNELLSAGWELQGGVSICTSDSQCYTEYCQAMVLALRPKQWFAGSMPIFEHGDGTEFGKRPFLKE